MTSNVPAHVRAFIAIELPDDLKRALSQVMDNLAQRAPRDSVRWARPEGLHLTLQFLGDVAAAQLPAVQAALAAAAQVAQPARLVLSGLGTFGGSNVRVVWVGVQGELESLLRLQAAVQAGTGPLGFLAEGQFAPHLTLGRARARLTPPEARQLAELARRTPVGPVGEFTAQAVSLMRSDLRPGGSVYTRLFAAPLAG